MGRSVPRLEDAKLLRGAGRFVDDIDLPHLLHATFVRSPMAHGLLQRVDIDKARALPGVRAVLTYADLRRCSPAIASRSRCRSLALRFHVDPCILARQGGVLRRRARCAGRRRKPTTGRGCRGSGRARSTRRCPRWSSRAPDSSRARPGRGSTVPTIWSPHRVVEYGDVEARIRRRCPSVVASTSHAQGRRPFDRGARSARTLRCDRRVAHGLGQHADAAQDQAGLG